MIECDLTNTVLTAFSSTSESREERLERERTEVAGTSTPAQPRRAAIPTTRAPRMQYTVKEFGVTITRDSSDIDENELLPLLKTWIESSCEKAFFGIERGFSLHQKHFQGTVRISIADAGSLTKEIKKALHIKKDSKYTVQSKTLTGKNMHTFQGMVAYCSKDANFDWFKSIEFNVSEEDKAIGEDLYLRFGAGDLKNRVALTFQNIFDRAFTFKTYRMRGGRIGEPFPRVLLKMIRSKRFYPSANWVVPKYGEGMDVSRANAAWFLTCNPGDAQIDDIEKVFFGRNPRIRDPRYFEAVADVDIESGPTS